MKKFTLNNFSALKKSKYILAASALILVALIFVYFARESHKSVADAGDVVILTDAEVSDTNNSHNSGEEISDIDNLLNNNEEDSDNAKYDKTEDENRENDNSLADDENDIAVDQTSQEKDYTDSDLVDFDKEQAFSYCSGAVCRYDANRAKLTFSFEMTEGIPRSDNDNIYLFEISNYESENAFEHKKLAAISGKGKKVSIDLPFRDRYLFSRFVPTILFEGEYVPLADGQFITNPEALSKNNAKKPEPDSKKGLLLDANTIGTDYLDNLNVKRVVFNMPLSLLVGESDNPDIPSVDFEYNGKIYYFNGYRLAGYDSLFSYLEEEGYHTTAIILNDWNKDYPEMMHPKSRWRTGKSMYYAFNTEEEDGVRLIEATALFLAKRYSGGEYGMVHDWVIANEVNQQKIWNYMACDDLNYYTKSFERSFRIFYNAIKSSYADSNVYFSIDQDWNNNWGNNENFFNGRDLLYKFNEYAKAGGDYDWNLAIHPYPYPLPKVKFWRGDFDKTEDARVVTPMNLSAVTSFMNKSEFLNTKGKVRDIAVTELGFSSRAGENLQAAAFAYCYYIIEDNEYISSFLLNRQTDDADSLRSGLALGIYNKDYSSKELAEVFKNVDTPAGKSYISEMLEIIGFESLEEALEKAR